MDIDDTKALLGLNLVFGPLNSGKSKWAELLVMPFSPVTYIFTSQEIKDDKSWSAKIEIHKKRRPKNWIDIQSKGDLGSNILNSKSSPAVLIDSLGGFITANIKSTDEEWNALVSKFIQAISIYSGRLVIVIEEIGWDLIPATKSGYIFSSRINDLTVKLELNSISKWLVIHRRALDITTLGHKVI